jgi:NADPH:quinone reductase-like Zn-dependent oxidoreductase
MRVVTQQAFGPVSVLETVEVDLPSLVPTEVLIRVRAIGVNPVDAMIRSGDFPLFGAPPFVLGWEISGTIEQVGPGVDRFVPGDDVFGFPLFPRQAAAYAEYVAAPSYQLAAKPAELSHEQAAALPVAGLTAWHGLVDGAGVRAGQRVLVHGGGGGVGHVTVQVAKALGAYVITTVSAGKREFVLSIGADEVIDYRAVDFTEATGDIDIVFDAVGGGYGERSLRVLRPGGVLAEAVDYADRELRAVTERSGMRWVPVTVEPDRPGLLALAGLAAEGKLRPYVDQAVPFEDAAKAHELVEAGHLKGKIVLTV